VISFHHNRPGNEIQGRRARRPPRHACYSLSLARPPFQLVSRAGLSWLESSALARIPWLLHAFSTRRGGVSRGTVSGLNLGFVAADRRRNVLENRRRFLTRLGAGDFSLATLRQVHSTHIFQVAREKSGALAFFAAGSPVPQPSLQGVPVGDALLTDQEGIVLSVRTADCLPVLLVDPLQRAVAAVHAGWRGGLQHIVEKAVGVVHAAFGSNPRRMLAAVGPGIRACCYEVGEEVVAAYCGRFTHPEQFFRPLTAHQSSRPLADHFPLLFLSPHPPGHAPPPGPAACLDLAAVVETQLRDAGLPARNIAVCDYCTSCRTDLFFSHRKEGGRTGRMMAVVGIRP
jgi:YfiH family protein